MSDIQFLYILLASNTLFMIGIVFVFYKYLGARDKVNDGYYNNLKGRIGNLELYITRLHEKLDLILKERDNKKLKFIKDNIPERDLNRLKTGIPYYTWLQFDDYLLFNKIHPRGYSATTLSFRHRVCKALGQTAIKDIIKMDMYEIMLLPGIADASISYIKDCLAAVGMKLKPLNPNVNADQGFTLDNQPIDK